VKSFAALLQRQWNQGGWLSDLLQPLSRLTARAARSRREAYLGGRRAAWRAPVPVVVVGNVYVGGTGKTPVVIAAVQGLRELGWTPGVVSRGYGAKLGETPRVGLGDALPASAYGDEPALIARATGAPVAVHPRRALAAQALLRAHPEVDVIVSDDGLQHLALARDVEIVVQDERGIGNGRLLPAGPLREPASRLDEVDAVVTNGGEAESIASAAARSACPVGFTMRLEPGHARRLKDGATRPLAEFAAPGAGPIAAAAGIGNPRRFFDTLRAAGVPLDAELPLPDHYAYASSPFAGLSARHILVTSKDAVKCAALLDERLWEVPASARFSPSDLAPWLSEIILRKTGLGPTTRRSD
jgi:tetraacyldisaccharide 4'-kinase